MTKDPKEPREFSCMDDHDNDGWGNSTVERDQELEEREDVGEPNDDFDDFFGEQEF